MNKKNIDELFQEKFRDFGEVPDKKVWNTIEASLNKKKKKRVIPIWWKLGGAAAILTGVVLAINLFSTPTDAEGSITDTKTHDNKQTEGIKQGEDKDFQESSISNENAITHTQNDSGSEEGDVENTAHDQDVEHKLNTLPKENTNRSKTSKTNRIAPSELTEAANPSKDKTQEPYNAKKEASDNNLINPEAENALAGSPSTGQDTYASDDGKEGATSPIDQDQEKHPDPIGLKPSEGIVQNAIEDESPNIPENQEDITEKKSIFDEIDPEEEIANNDGESRWSLGPNIAPVYYDALGNGSPVNAIFSSNSKSGSTNMSYGLSIAYAVNDKLRVRSGVNKVDYGYDTQGVEFSGTLQAVASDLLKNISYSGTSKNVVLQSETANIKNYEVSDNSFAPSPGLTEKPGGLRNGSMAQQFGYLEVPLELEYALIDRKLGLNLLGGVSSLFLIDNSISLSSGDLTTEIGEANNVNSVNFSTNVGFGVNYKFTPKIRLNIEPVFKYQLNTFSNVSGDFRPFSVGVYSGLNFMF
ncbi:hypothetical protein [Zobellia galactanivorans]|uniref:hypothetical protein n=1 Tax=Zobellia galactanivorans (strain DSM 12802 / CCUG 47099 / CIP 106680 / NCIMB 13871 / Dsij) TaxID=63186 RepID=UPI001C07C6D8|nr:hypothetical protein [Zobellia galactanivorans]MBU3026640.1 hypothetical protein [Zobellia galactanivorans]